MATSAAARRSRSTLPGKLAPWLFTALALMLTAGNGTVQATWPLPRLVIIGYQLVTATPKADGTEVVFRARLLNLGPAIPGAVATLSGESGAVTIVDDTVSFGPIGHLKAAWSIDTAAIRRHGSWLDLLSTLRWSIRVVSVNQPPTSDAGPDRSARIADRVVLDGSGSADPDGDPLTYRWSWEARPAGSVAELTDPSAVRPEFTVDVPGRYVLSLVVHDGSVWSGPDSVEVNTENTPPVSDAGEDLTVAVGAIVQVDGSGSFDADGDVLTFAWAIVDRPAASQAALDDAAAVRPRLSIDVPGIYVLELTVSDGQAASLPDSVVLRTDNSRPTADAGPDQTVQVGQEVSLDGSGSTDVDGDPLTWAWSLVARPAGSLAVLQNATTLAPSFVADQPGTYVAQLVVNDGLSESVPDAVTISTLNSAPVADAGDDQTVVAGAVVVLDGGGSSDPDGDALSFRWMLAAVPAGSAASIADPGAAVTSFVADQPGDYAVQLVVNDGELDSAPDAALVSTVNSAPVADAGPDQADVPLASTVTLDGSRSSDADGHPLTFSWALISRPEGSLATLAGVTTAAPDFVPDVFGDYVAQLVVNDGFADSAPDTVRVTTEAPPALVSVRATDGVAAEAGLAPGTYTLLRVGPTAASLTVFYTVTGTATAAVDYVALPGSATFPAGEAETTLTVAPLDDALIEGPETVVIVLDPGPGYTVGALDQASVTIEDDERPAVTIVVSDNTASEAGPDAGAFLVARTGPTTTPLTVFFSVAGTATEGIDYEDLGGRVTIPAGAASAPVAITPVDDTLIEGAENVILTLDPHAAYVVVVPGIAGLTIADDDLAQVTIEASDPSAGEAGPDPGLFTLRRSGDTASPLTVFLAAGGSAIATDYGPIGLIVTIPAGDAAFPFALTPLADNLVEGPEQLTLTVQPNLAYVVGSPAAATVTIADDPVVVSVVAAGPEALEAGLQPGAFLLTRSGGNTAAALSASVAIGGTATANRDYVVLSGVVAFAAGQETATVPVVPLPDNVVEAAETVVLTINPGPGTTYLVGSPSVATVTVVDDPPVVQVTTTDGEAAEAGLDPGTVTFTRTGGDLATALNVFFTKGGTAANGADYQSLGGAVSLISIPSGQTSASVTVAPVADNLVEGPETAELTLAPNAGYSIGLASSASVMIADDPPVVDLTASDPEAAEAGPDPGTFTFTRSGGNLSAPLTVSFTRGGTALNVTDFVTIPSSVTFPAGQASFVLTITPIDDGLVEGAETVILTVNASGSVVVGPSATATVVIADND